MPDSRKSQSRRVVRRHQPADGGRGQPSLLSLRPGELWRLLKSYVGLDRNSREQPIRDRAELMRFIDTRASFMAQTSLYGYLRTRAGMRYPELFDDDPFVESINIAKWQIWLACLSDLAVYAGSRLAQHAPRETERVRALMQAMIDEILEARGAPAEAGGEFAVEAERVRDRIARVDWLAVGEHEAAFTESPTALVRWAPIVEELKELDEDIVRNSVRFRWQEVRRDLARDLDPQSVFDSLPDPAAGHSA
jgi:hypothetical protein